MNRFGPLEKLYSFTIFNYVSAFNAMQNEKNDQIESVEHFSKLSNPDYVTIDPEYNGPDLTFPIDEKQIKVLIDAFQRKEGEKICFKPFIIVNLPTFLSSGKNSSLIFFVSLKILGSGCKAFTCSAC